MVGAGIPIAAGAATAIRLKGGDQVVACFFGDGAANIGAFHEGINLAATWRLPVVFVCENNLYAQFTPQRMHAATPDLFGRAQGYGILVPLGVADVKRPGKDLTVIATSRQVLRALEAAAVVAREDGYDVEVVDPRTLYPLDKRTILASVRKTHRALIVHEAAKRGGRGAEVLALVTEEAFDDLDAPVVRVAAPNTPIPFAPVMEDFVIPSVDDIVAGMRRALA
ncbi:MAG TPA: transketolase C-terminal domain-containing protein [Chloroflexota bacterium]|nr:transketolase C-terminal domain-containing protein [Chloroflexota bacterium]